MRLSVSQIAWDRGGDPQFLGMLREHGFEHIDVAPTTVWPDWVFRSPSPAEFRQSVVSFGLEPWGMQSIFFGRSDINVFGNDSSWKGLQEHFRRVCDLAAILGVRTIVFGAPANRDAGRVDVGSREPMAAERFQLLGDIAQESGAVLCLEPVPATAGGTFLRTTAECAGFVRRLRHPALMLNLDTAALSAEAVTASDAAALVAEYADVTGHVHASEPGLGSFGTPLALHGDVAGALLRTEYKGAVAIEMRATRNADRSRENLLQALRFVARVYRPA